MVRYGFEPTIDEQTTTQLVGQYKNNPNQFDYNQAQLIRDHATHYKIKPPDTELAENSFGSILSQAGKGWISGFTTLNIDHGDAEAQPRSSWERIARSLGHLGGFVGYLPGPRLLTKLGMAKKLSTNLLKLRGKSIPLMIGGGATKGLKKTAIGLGKTGVDKKGKAFNTVERFMDTTPGDMIEGAVNLGIASGVSAWQEGIHAVADATLGGGIAGAGFRAIGNIVKIPGTKPILPGTKLKDLTSAQINEKALKGIAGSLMMGLPATVRGATTEEQIYDYLLGAFFGQGEQYIKNRRAVEHLNKMKVEYKDPETGVRGTSSPELIEGWERLDAKTQDIIKEITVTDAEQGGVISYILARDELSKLKEMQDAEQKAKEIYEGEPIERIKKPEEELVESKEGKGNDGETSPELVDTTQKYEALFTKSKHYVQTYLENQFTEAPNRQRAMEDTWRLVNRKWNDIVGENISKNSQDNPAYEMIKWVNKRFKKTIAEDPKDAEYSFWIKWGQARKYNKPVGVASIVLDINPALKRVRNNKDPDVYVDKNPDVRLQLLNPRLESDAVNLAGNSKQLREPVKNIEIAYQQEFYKRHGVVLDTKTEPVYVVLDNIVSNQKSNGRFHQESTFGDWRRQLTKNAESEAESHILQRKANGEEIGFKKARELKDQFIESKVESDYNEAMASITKQMAEEGYMYLGGKGDAERLYFVKQHPFLSKRMKVDNKDYRPNALLRKFLKRVKNKFPEIEKDYLKEKEVFIKGFSSNPYMSEFIYKNTLSKKEAGALFDRTFLNNMLYDFTMNGLEISSKNFDVLNTGNMITSPKNVNKRSQIWFTNGLPSDMKFMKNFISDNYGRNVDPDNNNGFSYVLFKDSTKKGLHLESKAEDYVHTTDGEIITLPEIVDALNAGQGMPYGKDSGAVNKSFIVSPDATFGALLGKYQFKSAPAELAEAMRAQKLDMLIPESSAKQSGTRDMWDSWEWKGQKGVQLNSKNNLDANKRYVLKAEDVKVIPSEITSDKFIKPQRLPKQMQSNLTPFGFNPIKQKVIDNLFDRASKQSFEGQKEMNDFADALIKDPTNVRAQENILKDLESLGIPRLLELMSSPKHEDFAIKAYRKILRIQEDVVSDMQSEGEISSMDAHSMKLDAMEWQSVYDRIIQLKPNSIVPLLHKVGDNYRQSVMRNYILAQIVKPRLLNSAATRMTGYDPYLKTKLPEMNKKDGDNIFYLDNGHRRLRIYMDDGSSKTLGQLWDIYNKKGTSKEAKENIEGYLEAVGIRVPMDSLSGAHKLKFAGFTGRDGFGSVLHPRTMEALGGADLDGDKATIFFGGEKHGFRKDWREAYHSQRQEYYVKDKKTGLTVIENNKPQDMRDLLTNRDQSLLDRMKSAPMRWSPALRYEVSKGAYLGRGMLGPAVTNKSNILAAYNQVRSALDSYGEKFLMFSDGFKDYTLTPKVSKKALSEFRRIARASVAFASDPMDEAGLKGTDVFFNNIFDSLFKLSTKVRIPAKEKGKKDFILKLENADFSSAERKKAFVNIMSTINSAGFGKNLETGRAHSPYDFNEAMKKVKGLPKGKDGKKDYSFNSKIAELTENIPMSDSLLERTDRFKLDKWYEDIKDSLSSKPYLEIMEGLGRRSFSIPKNSPLEVVIENGLFHPDARSSAYQDKPMFNYLLTKYPQYFMERYLMEHPDAGRASSYPTFGIKIDKAIKQLYPGIGRGQIKRLQRFGNHRKVKRGNKVTWVKNDNGSVPHDKFTRADLIMHLDSELIGGLPIKSRKKIIDSLINLAKDSVTNDLGDYASARLINEAWNRESVSKEKFSAMANTVDSIQRLKSKQDLERDALEPLQDMEMSDTAKARILELERSIEGSTTTREFDQRQIDEVIRKEKSGMTMEEADLFDAMLVSSWKKGTPELVERLKKARININKSKDKYSYKSYKALEKYITNKEKQLDQTEFNRVGFASKEVSDSIIKRQLDIMEEAFGSIRYEDVARDTKVADQITKNLEAENKKQPLFDDAGKRTQGLAITASDYSTKTQKYLEDYAPFKYLEKNKDIKVLRTSKKLMNDLISHLDYYGPQTRENFHLIVRDLVNKDINTMKLEDWQIVNNIFKDHKDGTWFQKTFSKVSDKFPTLKKRYYRMFPEAIDRDIMRHEIRWNETDTIYKDANGNWITGKGKNAQGWMGELQRNIHLSQELATMENQREEREWQDLTEPYMTTEMGRDLWDYAVKRFESDFVPQRLRETSSQGDKLAEEYARTYEKRIKEAEQEVNWAENKDRLLTLTSGVRKTGKELVQEIQDMLARRNFENHKRLTGDEATWKEFVQTEKNGELEVYRATDKDGNVVKTDIPVIKRKKMLEFIQDYFVNNKPFPIEKLGIDGQRKLIIGMQMGQIRDIERASGDRNPLRIIQKDGLSEKLSDKILDMKTGMLGKLGQVNGKGAIYGYYPHVAKMFDKGVLTGDLTRKIQTIYESNRPKAEKDKMIAKLYMRSKQLQGEFVESDIINDSWEVITDYMVKKSNKQKTDNEIKWFERLDRIGNQFSRENHVDGWDVSPEAYLEYTNSITKTFYRNLGQILSRETINNYAKEHVGLPKEVRTGWMNFFKLYAQQSLGYPAIVPKEMFDNENMKIKGTLYGALADNRVAMRMDSIGRKLGLIGKGKDLPKEFRGLDKLTAQSVINLGNAEAKYSLATLLAHPKSSVGNYMGGSQMTIVNAGLNNFINAKKIDYLRKTIDPNFKTWEDVNRWVKELGIIEEFIIREIGANPQLSGKNFNAFLRDFKQMVRKNPELPDVTLKDLMSKHRLSQNMMDVAGKFMSLPERALRRDSFIAHYLQARDKLGGRTLPKDHPYLIEMGKKGVKATQFLYSVPFRPMFAGTAMGKVISRFQLWAWNSVRYRNTIIREAATRGISEGSQEFQRFKRLMIADTMSIALGSMFMYSLFGSQLPQPYAWFQDLASWMFGNEKERDRAFFGAYPGALAPLQLITPPSFRMSGPILNGLINDDWEKMSNYYIWTMFPFGRLARDLVGPGGLTENPYYGIDKLTGIPVVGAKRIATSRKKKEEQGEDFYTPPLFRQGDDK